MMTTARIEWFHTIFYIQIKCRKDSKNYPCRKQEKQKRQKNSNSSKIYTNTDTLSSSSSIERNVCMSNRTKWVYNSSSSSSDDNNNIIICVWWLTSGTHRQRAQTHTQRDAYENSNNNNENHQAKWIDEKKKFGFEVNELANEWDGTNKTTQHKWDQIHQKVLHRHFH